MTISGGTANFSGSGLVSPVTLNLSGGSLGGASTMTVKDMMNWTGGDMTGSGRLIVSPGATLNVANPAQVNLTTRTLENGGTVIWTGDESLVMNPPRTHYQSPWGALRNPECRSDCCEQCPCRFDNAGTFRKSVNAGTTTVPLNFNNSGTVDIRRGILVANLSYVSSANALLNCALGGAAVGAGYGQLQVSGIVNVNGALSVDLINGFIPATNDTFTVLTAGTRNGTFNNFLYPSNAVTMQLSNRPNSVIVRVTDVLTAIPQPMLLPPVLSGSDFKLTWTAASNTTYRVEFNPNLVPSNWNALSGDVTASSNIASKLDPLTPSNRLYRVRIVP